MNSSARRVLSRTTVQLVISLLGLLFLRILVGALPILSNSGPVPGFDVTAAVLAKTIVDTLMLAAVLAFGRQISREINGLRPVIPDLGMMIYLMIIVIVIGIAYRVYEEIARGLLEGDLASYSWLFLIAILLPLSYLGVLIFQNLESITDLILERAPLSEGSSRSQGSCPACGENIEVGEKFCVSCGENLADATRREEQRARQQSNVCSHCGATHPLEANFCRSCGNSLDNQQSPIPVEGCPSCGATNDQEARYCRRCGAAQGAKVRPNTART